MKPKLLIVELWGLGDLAIATQFLRAATEKYEVTLLAKVYAVDLAQRFWPGVRVEPLNAPWTAFRGKYRLWKWPFREFFRLRRVIQEQEFSICVSSRWDPRDHALMRFFGIPQRFGFPRLNSQMFLTQSLQRPDPGLHRYEQWRVLGHALGLNLPTRPPASESRREKEIDVVIHTGAARAFCIWPLEHFQQVLAKLRAQNYSVRVLCDQSQRDEWNQLGEQNVLTPSSVRELVPLVEDAGIFIGNDSGPGHLAALCGLPTFTLFGPHFPEGWAPLHPEAAWIPGRPCPYKPCEARCEIGVHRCLVDVSAEEAWRSIEPFVQRHGGNRKSNVPVPNQMKKIA
ncbi:MAG TPA: glycosyltransferase family 9 protein [Candidatus Limnocylindria bacterium]|nr:glycosyltransferase family 9 protein [Candidatus Limnocylindria bacterium]